MPNIMYTKEHNFFLSSPHLKSYHANLRSESYSRNRGKRNESFRTIEGNTVRKMKSRANYSFDLQVPKTKADIVKIEKIRMRIFNDKVHKFIQNQPDFTIDEKVSSPINKNYVASISLPNILGSLKELKNSFSNASSIYNNSEDTSNAQFPTKKVSYFNFSMREEMYGIKKLDEEQVLREEDGDEELDTLSVLPLPGKKKPKQRSSEDLLPSVLNDGNFAIEDGLIIFIDNPARYRRVDYRNLSKSRNVLPQKLNFKLDRSDFVSRAA